MSGSARQANSTRYRRAVSKCRDRGDACAICWQPIDYALKTPDPMSFEADHIVPVSKGGEVFDPANMQAAHRCCNIWRGSKSMAQVDAIMSGDAKPRTPPPIWRDGERPEQRRAKVVPTFGW